MASDCDATKSEAQKSEFGENRVWIDGRCLHVYFVCKIVNIKNAKTGVQLNSGLSPDFSVQL